MPARMRRMYYVVVITILASCLFLLACQDVTVTAKEVEATNEWTLLGENDTVGAGMHIRMDLTTGEKWVKLPDSDPQEETVSLGWGAVTLHQVAVSVNGEPQHKREKEEAADPSYDFDMMHRTLDQLPDDEKARMQFPDAPNPGMTPEQRLVFEKRMKEIWVARQEELKHFEEQFVADLPKILRDRVQRLQDYISDPYKELTEMDLNHGEENYDENVVTHIVSVLADLEYHLTDIDMTRDFYTLGGWPLLVSLLMDDTHVNKFNETPTDEIISKIHIVQAYAAWALGTAVKNTGEFSPYSVHPLVLVNPKKTTASALTVLLEQISSTDLALDAPKEAKDKLHKYIYALGSFLRGNPRAQKQFTSLGGGSAVGNLLESCVERLALNPNARKTASRLLALADDVVTEVGEHDGESSGVIEGFSSPTWCEAALRAMQISSPLQPTALKTVRTLVPYCRHSQGWSTSLVRDQVQALHSDWKDELASADGNPEVLQERIDLAESVLAILS